MKQSRGVLVCVREQECQMQDDETKMKEQSWWLSSLTAGRSYSIKLWMALSAAAPAKRPMQPSPCHRLPLMLGREGGGKRGRR